MGGAIDLSSGWNPLFALFLHLATESEVDDPEPVQVLPETRTNRGRKRGVRTTRGMSSVPSKRGRRVSSSVDIPLLPPPEPQAPARVEQEKPDANMCLKVNWQFEKVTLQFIGIAYCVFSCWTRYEMYVYIEVCSHLHILDPRHMVLPFSPLWLHFSLFTVVHIVWNVSTVTTVIYFMAEFTCMSTMTHSEADSRLCNFMNMQRNDHITFPNRAKSFTIVNFYFTSSTKHSSLSYSVLQLSCHQLHKPAALFHFIPRAVCLYSLHCLTFCAVGWYRSSDTINCYWQFIIMPCSTHLEWMRGGSG